MIRKLLYFLGLVFMLSSCYKAGILTSSVHPNEIKYIPYFEPVVYVNYIREKSIMEYDDSLSAISYYNVDSILTAKSSKYRLSEKIIANNEQEQEKLDTEIFSLVESLAKRNTLSNVVFPPTVKKVIKRSNKRFGLALVEVGYIRSDFNYIGKSFKEALLAPSYTGYYGNYVYKARTKVYVVIFDTLHDNLALYGESLGMDLIEPTNSRAVTKKINKIFRVYY
ncbi:hypothetical protein [Chondrinema litorale]|uniref:hypothetical protein n=1 Tax=Chondrinema litorale TaxID=2994555 RepID=UPI002543F7D0|nr:hypothetical protein [Chondrinema litorale]UZR97667.1 hypothetical protein OQ292_28080 [Chondrinema litorale]